MKTRAVLISLVFGVVVLPIRAQQKGVSEDANKHLAYFVGAWDVAVKFKMPDGKEGGGKASCKTKWVLDNTFIHQDYTSNFMGKPLVVWQLQGYDSVKKKLVEFQIHQQGKESHTMTLEGSFSQDGKVLTLLGDALDSFSGKTVKMRTVTTIIDKDHYTLEWFMTEPGGKEQSKVVLTHTRKK